MTEAYKQTSHDSKASKAKAVKCFEDMLQCRKKIQEDTKNNRENETQLRKVRSYSYVRIF